MNRLAVGMLSVVLAAELHGASVAADAAATDTTNAPEAPVTWAPAPSSIVNPSWNTDQNAWEAYRCMTPPAGSGSSTRHLDGGNSRGDSAVISLKILRCVKRQPAAVRIRSSS